MAIASAILSHKDDDNNDKDDHAQDDVMPGFRFHPTEEELVEFYLRRKVEGKQFNVELITFLDLYRYDPWELPALAAIGEKEWFFYVPRDRKYRNGDRPNRVTTSGYWKATGTDRMIKNESSRSIGRKKTLVFYSGKAPKGIRTGWIMNEYRLLHKETYLSRKVEISLCRVYKRARVEDHCPLPSAQSSRPSLSKGIQTSIKNNLGFQATSSQAIQYSSPSSERKKLPEMDSTSTADDHRGSGDAVDPTSSVSSTMAKVDGTILHHSKQEASFLPAGAIFSSSSSSSMPMTPEFCKLVGYQHNYTHRPSQIHLPSPRGSHSLPTHSDKLWEWNSITEANRDYTNCK